MHVPLSLEQRQFLGGDVKGVRLRIAFVCGSHSTYNDYSTGMDLSKNRCKMRRRPTTFNTYEVFYVALKKNSVENRVHAEDAGGACT